MFFGRVVRGGRKNFGIATKKISPFRIHANLSTNRKRSKF